MRGVGGRIGAASEPIGRRNYTLGQIVGKLFPFFRPEGRRFGLTLALVALKVGGDIFLLLLCRSVLTIVEDTVKGGGRGPVSSLWDLLYYSILGKPHRFHAADLPGLLWLMGGSIALFLVAGYYRSFVPSVLISNVAFSIRRSLYEHLQCMDLYFFDRTRSGEISSRLTNDINQGVQVFGMTLSVFLFQAVVFAASLVIMWRVNATLTLAALAVGLMFVVNARLFVPRLRERSRAVQEKLGSISGEVSEKFSGIKVMQSFTSEGRELAQFTERIDDHRESSIDMARISSFTSIVGQSIPQIGNAAILGLGAYIVLDGKLSLADLTFVWMMRGHLFQPFQIFTHLAEEIARGLGGLDRVFEFFDTDSRVTDRPGVVPLKKARGEVEFRGVSFEYDGLRRHQALVDISFRAEPGTSVALVGASGSGKTTTVDLLSRFYDPTGGAILIDGRDIRGYTLRSLRDTIGVVMQEAILFSGSIRDNVRYGRPDATGKEIRGALEMANAWDFVAEMPDLLDTVLGERGVSLSGGQRQRIAIARAFLKNPPVLVLDEATSALDSVSELFVQEAIDRLMEGRTTFVIAHRLSTIANVDRVLVLDRGRLVEEGTHGELLGAGGFFAEFHNRQYGNFTAKRE